MDTGQWIAIGLSAVLGAWYVVGALINRRRGVATYQWLQKGLEQIGKISEAKWIGSSGSGARLLVTRAARPFRRIEIIFLLESREIMPIWLFNRLRDKQDEMILKAVLRKPPAWELEAAPEGDRKLKGYLSNPGEGRTPFEQVSAPEGFSVLARRRSTTDDLEALSRFLAKYPKAVVQFSLRKQPPHLILRLKVPPVRQSVTAETLLAELAQVLSPVADISEE